VQVARKLVAATVAGILVVMSLAAFLRVDRERRLFEVDTARDHSVLGRPLAEAIERVWRREGRVAAESIVAQANARDRRVRFRIVPAAADLAPLRSTRGRIETRVPLRVDGARAALEIAESRAFEHAYVRASIAHNVVAAGAIVAVCAAIAVGLGWVVIGRPIHAVVEKARRVGAGDLSGPLETAARDEIGELAREVNAMCERLGEARTRLERETAGRIAALEQLRHADRLRSVGQLAAGLAHELGTPLNVIQARARLLGAAVPSASDDARIIAEQAGRVTRIVRSLLDFARRQTPHKARVDLGAIARRTVEVVEALARERGVTLEVVGDGLPVDADAGQIVQALTNLVLNGVQAMPDGGTLRLVLGEKRSMPPADIGGDARPFRYVAVEDAGVGMTPEVRARALEPFFTTKDVGQGTGLGLPVAWGIVRDHGGYLEIECESGCGCTVTMHLPVDGASSRPPRPGSEAGSAAAAAGTTRTG
jgi:two-component system, NtrC family, sensor kinase